VAASVELDTARFVADMRRFGAGMERVANTEPARAAANTAGKLRQRLPRRTGRLAGSVHTTDETGGAGVSYGAGVPYARYIDRRTGAVDAATAGAGPAFALACAVATAREVGNV